MKYIQYLSLLTNFIHSTYTFYKNNLKPLSVMETNQIKNMYEKLVRIIESTTNGIHSMLTEINYMKLAGMERNERNILNSTSLMLVRYAELSKEMQKLLSVSVDIIKELEVNKDDLTAIKIQIDSSNKELLNLSNAMTNYTYFIKQNLSE